MRRAPLLSATPPWLPFALVPFALLLLVVPALPADASGGIDVRRAGASWARIEDGGNIRIEGRLVGSIEANGTVRVAGRLEGDVNEEGTVRQNGRVVGSVEKDGTLRAAGALLGQIEKDGTIRRQGALWGNASSCCPRFHDVRRVAALLFFFDRGFFGP